MVPVGMVPFTPLVGVIVKATPLQEVAVIAETVAAGLTITVTVKVPPVKEPFTGVTVYVAVWDILVGLKSVPEILLAADPETPPVNPPDTEGAGQE